MLNSFFLFIAVLLFPIREQFLNVPFLSPSLWTVPSAVGEVTVSNNGRTDFLSVSWRQASGDVDSYLVTLSQRERAVHAVTVSKTNSKCDFSSLIPGHLYNISITTRSGIYENHTFVQERTRK